ncbi:MAG TPA: hypothetical protein VF406_16095 [Thermodesulfobacteriota bacterium]
MDVERDRIGCRGAGRTSPDARPATPGRMPADRLAALRALVARGFHDDPDVLAAAADRILRSGDLRRASRSS